MKKCPKCQSTFNVDSITFCPLDGTALVNIAEQNDSAGVAVAAEVPSTQPHEPAAVVGGKVGNGRKMTTPMYIGAMVIAGVLLVVGWMIFGNKAGGAMKNDIGMEFSWIPAGSFMMGSPTTEANRLNNEGPQRLVTIRQGFWMGRYEVTQGQYEAVMGTNPSNFNACGKDCPVDRVSWHDAKEFIAKLNARNDGFVYSLPSEAEWEYAARAGTTTATAFGDSLSSTQANFNGNDPYGNAPKGPYLGRTTKVGSYDANAWGLYDMHGNVHEWVEDILQDSYTGLPTDGSANTLRGYGFGRVLRGGSWFSLGLGTRSAYRLWDFPTLRDFNLGFGFRVVARAL